MHEFWRKFKIGDKVRVVAWPPELPAERNHRDTNELYQWLIDTRSLLTIVEIDAFKMPHGEICRVVDGIERFEFLILNHGGLELVSPLSPS